MTHPICLIFGHRWHAKPRTYWRINRRGWLVDRVGYDYSCGRCGMPQSYFWEESYGWQQGWHEGWLEGLICGARRFVEAVESCDQEPPYVDQDIPF